MHACAHPAGIGTLREAPVRQFRIAVAKNPKPRATILTRIKPGFRSTMSSGSLDTSHRCSNLNVVLPTTGHNVPDYFRGLQKSRLNSQFLQSRLRARQDHKGVCIHLQHPQRLGMMLIHPFVPSERLSATSTSQLLSLPSTS